MKLQLFIKIFALTGAIAMTVYGIYLLRSDLGHQAFEKLGFEEHGENTVSWCQSRVAQLQVATDPDKRLVEQNRQWMAYQPEAEPVGYLEVERWFGEYCQVEAQPVKATVGLDYEIRPLIKVEFVNGQSATLLRVGPDMFQWKGKLFKSEALEKGLTSFSRFLDLEDFPFRLGERAAASETASE